MQTPIIQVFFDFYYCKRMERSLLVTPFVFFKNNWLSILLTITVIQMLINFTHLAIETYALSLFILNTYLLFILNFVIIVYSIVTYFDAKKVVHVVKLKTPIIIFFTCTNYSALRNDIFNERFRIKTLNILTLIFILSPGVKQGSKNDIFMSSLVT